MEKTIKKLSIIALMLVMVVSLVGCGKKEEKEEKKEKVDDNTIIATREQEVDGLKYKEKTEVKLKDKKIDNVKMTMTCDDEETATQMKEQLEATVEMMKAMIEGLEIKISGSGKNITMELDAKSFSLMAGSDMTEQEITKEELKEVLKEEGYTVE